MARTLGNSSDLPLYVHLLRARDLIDRRYGHELEVSALAAEACSSPSHFIRSFRKAFGETPHGYLRRRRIERAMERLRATNAPVSQVALDVGFATPSSFATAFRELVGETPSGYAARWRGASEPPIPGCFARMYGAPPNSAIFGKPPSPPRPMVAGVHEERSDR